jgi:hypothetical protein
MPYIEREGGRIVGLFNLEQPGIAETYLPDDDAEVIAYRHPAPNPMDQLEAIITQGQVAMSETPLPDDIQKEIFDLEVFVQNYYRRGAIQLILSAIGSFSIAEDRTDVTEEQRTLIDLLKAQMLEVFDGL